MPEKRHEIRPQVEALEDRVLLTVFWPDDRTLVTNTTRYPWSAVARIVTTFRDGYKIGGSGAMVGSKHLLTAAHMVYNHAHGGWATSVAVSPGQNGYSKPFGTVYSTRLRSWTGWTLYGDTSSDMALVTLNKTIGYSTGWFGLKSNAISAGTGVNTAGYPGDKGGIYMYRAYGPVSYVSDGMAFYKGTLDAYFGQSGSPLWVYNSSTASRYIVGVHAAQEQDSSYNVGAVLTYAKYNTIVNWVNQDGGFRANATATTLASSYATASSGPTISAHNSTMANSAPSSVTSTATFQVGTIFGINSPSTPLGLSIVDKPTTERPQPRAVDRLFATEWNETDSPEPCNGLSALDRLGFDREAASIRWRKELSPSLWN